MTKPYLFTQNDTVRLYKSIHKAGLVVARVRILPDGTLEADVTNSVENISNLADNAGNEWDEVLPTQ